MPLSEIIKMNFKSGYSWNKSKQNLKFGSTFQILNISFLNSL